MTTGALYAVRQATLVSTVSMHNVITMKTLATLPRTVQRRSLHQKHHITMTGYAPVHVTITAVGTDPSPLTTDIDKEDSLTGQDHTAKLNMAEAPANLREMYPTSHPANAASHTTHQLTNALGNTLARTHHTSITVTHLRHATFPVQSFLLVVQKLKLI